MHAAVWSERAAVSAALRRRAYAQPPPLRRQTELDPLFSLWPRPSSGFCADGPLPFSIFARRALTDFGSCAGTTFLVGAAGASQQSEAAGAGCFPFRRSIASRMRGGMSSAGAGRFAGAGIRVDRSPIITTDSDLLPLRVLPDEAFLSGPERD